MLSPVIWLQLSQETRRKIATEMNIPKSSGVEVAGGRVLCDGHTVYDLQAITVEKLQEKTGLDISDFYALFKKYVLQLEEAQVVKEEPKAPEPIPTPEPATKEAKAPDTLFPRVKPNALYAEQGKKNAKK